MSTTLDIQLAITDQLRMHPGFPPAMKIMDRRQKTLVNDIQAALSKLGICIYVMPPLPRRVTQGDIFIFVEDSEIRIRILESPLLNTSGFDAAAALDQVCLALQWTNPGELFEEPIQLRNPPVEAQAGDILDVLFTGAYQINP